MASKEEMVDLTGFLCRSAAAPEIAQIADDKRVAVEVAIRHAS
jgi:hypothetical protein